MRMGRTPSCRVNRGGRAHLTQRRQMVNRRRCRGPCRGRAARWGWCGAGLAAVGRGTGGAPAPGGGRGQEHGADPGARRPAPGRAARGGLGPGDIVAVAIPGPPPAARQADRRGLERRDRPAGRQPGRVEHRQSAPSGPCRRQAVLGRVVRRYSPAVAGRPGAMTRSGPAGRTGSALRQAERGVRGSPSGRSTLAVMAWLETELERLLAPDYLDGLHERSLEEVRAMRAECQEAETAVSYLRRMAQGRLDLVHACLDHHGERRVDLDSLVEHLPSIIGSGPARPQGYGRLPSQMSPDLDRDDLTEEIDAVLDADAHRRAHDHERSRAPDRGRATSPSSSSASPTSGAPCTSASTRSRRRSSVGTRQARHPSTACWPDRGPDLRGDRRAQATPGSLERPRCLHP